MFMNVFRRSIPFSSPRISSAFKLFFLEDSLAPEDIEWFRMIRRQCATPIAMGELFNNPHEWRLLIEERLIDFLRMHVSQMGGITPARNAAIHAGDLRHPHRLAWSRRYLTGGSRSEPAPGCMGAQLRRPRVVPL